MHVLYAIPDVHGRHDLLRALVEACVSDAGARGKAARFVFLGDLIDRGPHSKRVLDFVASVLARHPASMLLKGNHEELALAVLASDPPAVGDVERWLDAGGMDTLESYFPGDADLGLELMRVVHGNHVEMLAAGQASAVSGGFLFAHAGVDPHKPFDAQSERDLLWTRDEFLDHMGFLPKIVVHGHSVVGDRPVVTENRISIDTGACSTGRLTACVIDGGDVSFMQTDGSAARVVAVEPVRLDRGLGTCLDPVIADLKLAA